MAKNSSAFGKRLRQFRIDRGKSQVWLAGYLTVSIATIVRWENGKAKPSVILRARAERLLEDATVAA